MRARFKVRCLLIVKDNISVYAEDGTSMVCGSKFKKVSVVEKKGFRSSRIIRKTLEDVLPGEVVLCEI